MLCRAVVTALAISCTFSREILAHSQATQRKVHRKDLICILWLSGLQKEDLDVNMLKKLQRHDVNIDDMSNDKLQQDCLQSKAPKDNTNEEEESTVDEEHTTATIKFENESATDILELISPNNMSEILQNLMDLQRPSLGSKTVIFRKNYTITQTPKIIHNKDDNTPALELINNNKENTNDNFTSTFKPNEKDSFEDEFDESAHNLESMFKLWKTFTNTKTTTAPIKTTHRSIEINPVKKMKKIDNDMGRMNKFLRNFFDVNSQPAIPTTTISPKDMSLFFKQMQQFYALLLKSNEHRENDQDYDTMLHKPQIEQKFDTELSRGYFFENNIPQQNPGLTTRKDKYVEMNLNKHSVRDMTDTLFLNDQLKKSHMTFNEPNLPKEKIYNPQYKQQISQPQWVNNAPYLSALPTISQTTIKENLQLLPADVIKEITENVKASVLKDLKQVVTSTVSSVILDTRHTSSTAAFSTDSSTAVPVAANTQNRTDDTSQVLKNIAELFEEFKMLKEKVMSTSTTTMPTTAKLGEITSEKNKSLIVGKNMTIRYMDAYKITKPPEILLVLPKASKKPNNAGYGSKNQGPIKVRHGTKNKVPIGRSNVYNPFIGASIIQTNSGEVPPLNIPVSKPLLLIHQNIVLTTMRSKQQEPWVLNHHTNKEYSDEIKYQRAKIKKYRGNQSQNRKNPPIYDPIFKKTLITSQHRGFPESIKNKKYLDNRQDGTSILHFHSNKNYNSVVGLNDYRRSKYDIEHEKNDNPDIGKGYKNMYDKPNRYDDKITVGIYNNDDRQSFHERLERVEEWEDGSRANCDKEKCGDNNLSITSRQQVSLNNIKSRYDDTHFKNFLKTQQKVSDMLERILATKTIPSQIRSVETT